MFPLISIFLWYSTIVIPEYWNALSTAEKMKFPIKDFFSDVIKSAVSCGFGHIY